VNEKSRFKKMAEKTKDCKNEHCKEKLGEITELLQRNQASFDNYRKQTEKRIQDILQLASRDVIVQMLPVMDNLQLALDNAQKHENHQEFIEGVALINSQLNTMLRDNGVKEIEAKKFDPYFHEALMKIESDLPENEIIEVMQRGFTLNDQVIRHARVKLSAGSSKVASSASETGKAVEEIKNDN
jgi:molecular chaperone GrpE (heat shock protein)